jgi:hypothetical protein
MLLSALLEQRLGTIVDGLEDRVQSAADLTEMLRQKTLPQSEVAAFVVPAGERATSQGDAATSAFTQMVDQVFAVILFVRAAGDATGKRGLVKLDPLKRAVIAAVAGWAPEDEELDNTESAIGVFRLSRGQLVSLTAGTQIYQLEFAIAVQLRIIS